MKGWNTMELTEKQLDREEIYNGIVLHVVRDKVSLPNGRVTYREMCLHMGAVGVVPLTKDGNVIMVKQFRYAHDRVFLEIPAGKLDKMDESPLEAAKRELKEETGLEAESWLHLCDTFTTPGFSNEKISLYLARDLVFGESRPDEDEFLNVVKMPFEEAFRMAMKGEIQDAKTLITLCMAKNII